MLMLVKLVAVRERAFHVLAVLFAESADKEEWFAASDTGIYRLALFFTYPIRF